MFTKYYLITITLLTFFSFGIDKWLAKKGRTRISELTLLLLTFIGGTIGSILGMAFFKHKNSKKSFFLKLSAVIALQLILIFLAKEHLESIRR